MPSLLVIQKVLQKLVILGYLYAHNRFERCGVGTPNPLIFLRVEKSMNVSTILTQFLLLQNEQIKAFKYQLIFIMLLIAYYAD